MTWGDGRRARAVLALAAVVVVVVVIVVRLADGEPPNGSGADAVVEGEVLFADEFDGSGPPDWSVWEPQLEDRWEARHTDDPANVRREDGHLVIEAHPVVESYGDPVTNTERGSQKGTAPNRTPRQPSNASAYTSGFIQTREAFRFGRFEARMKLPTAPGTWPAFWLVTDEFWPHGGEIDVMEHYADVGGDGSPSRVGRVESNLHSEPPMGQPELTSWERVTATPVDVDDWHTYAVEWRPGDIRFFVDGERTAVHRRPSADDPETWPFDDHDEVIAFDLFLGGFGGPIDDGALPARLLVDWVRVTSLGDGPG